MRLHPFERRDSGMTVTRSWDLSSGGTSPGPAYLHWMSIRWDSLLVRHLARELDERLAGRRLRAIRLDGRARDLVLLFRDAALVWRLHPTRSTVLLRPATRPSEGDHPLKARLRRVHAAPDERIVTFELIGERRGVGPIEVIVELIGNKLNAIVVEGEARTTRHVLVRRTGARPIEVGRAYAGPQPTARLGVDGDLSLERWKELLSRIPPSDRPRELVRLVAWSSRLNAEALLEPSLEDGYREWRRFVDEPDAGHAVVLETERGMQPYPFPLGDRPVHDTDSLIEAFEQCSVDAETEGVDAQLAVPPPLLKRLEDAISYAERRLTGLQAELDDREDPDALRSVGDLILARFSELPRGAERATLTGFDGQPVEVDLHPALEPHDNAAAYYDRASRSERAAERIPALISELEARRTHLKALRAGAAEGTIDADRIRVALPASKGVVTTADAGPSLPYRTFRSSGGLEIRVGRGAKHNDDLTFRHSSPDDVWLHARHAAGAHVILRWQSEDNPPARDLAQAGTLAALHSKARTSASVPVDWTRRKYVRKPRGSAPGAVVPDRVRTIFVRPDEKLRDALNDEP